MSCSSGAADKGQPSIIVSHLWAFVPGSATLLIPIMLACPQWTGAHQLGSVLARLCGPTAAWHTKKNPARHTHTQINTNTPHPHPKYPTPYMNKAAHVFTASSAPTLWIWITLWPRLKQAVPFCAVFKPSRCQHKDRRANWETNLTTQCGTAIGYRH